MRRTVRALLTLVLLLGCGCPQRTDDPVDPAPTDASSGSTKTPTPPSPPPVAPPEDGAGPSGPAGPSGGSIEDQTPDPDDGRSQVHLRPTKTLRVGKASLATWIVDGPKSRQLGLMHVRKMDADRGMLFVYPQVRRRSFWMRNTYIPLSLAYVAADGTIEQILDMKPLTRTSHPSKSAVRFVLEVNQGWFSKNGVKVGDVVQGIGGLRGY